MPNFDSTPGNFDARSGLFDTGGISLVPPIQSAVFGPGSGPSFPAQFTTSNVIAGDLIVVAIWLNNGYVLATTTATDDAVPPNVYSLDVENLTSAASDNTYAAILSATAVRGGGTKLTITVSMPGAVGLARLFIAEYPKAAATRFDTAASSGVNNASTVPTVSLTTAQANEVLFSIACWGGFSFPVGSAGAGYTLEDNQNPAAWGGLMQDQATGAPGSYSATATITGQPGQVVVLLAAYRINPTIAYTLSLSDSFSPSDVMFRAVRTFLNDAITLVESNLPKLTAARSVSDTLSITDAEANRANRPNSEVLVISDAIVRRGLRSFPDVFSPVDSLKKTGGRVYSEAVSLLDSTVLSTRRVFSDIAILTESFFGGTGHHGSDSLSISDSMLRSDTRNLNDSFSVSDSLRNLTRKLFLEVLSLVDVLSIGGSRVVSFIESFIPQDLLVKLVGRSMTESISPADAIRLATGKAVAEVASPSDSILLRAGHTFLEILSLSDARTAASSVHMSDLVPISEARTFAASSHVSDTIALSEVMHSGPAKPLAETLPPSDSLFLRAGRRFIEILTLSDFRSSGVSVHMADTAPLSDAIQPLRGVAMADSITPSDSLLRRTVRNFREVFDWLESLVRQFIPGLGTPRVLRVPALHRIFAAEAAVTALAVPALQRSFVAREEVMRFAFKHPASTEDFTYDLSALAGLRTITSISVPAVSPLTIVDRGATLPSVVLRIGGGVVGHSYVVAIIATLDNLETKTANLTVVVQNTQIIGVLKDPNSNQNFQVDWTPELGADTVASSTWPATPPSTITITNKVNDGGSASAWIGGGAVGKYTITNTILTTGGQVKACDLALTVSPQ